MKELDEDNSSVNSEQSEQSDLSSVSERIVFNKNNDQPEKIKIITDPNNKEINIIEFEEISFADQYLQAQLDALNQYMNDQMAYLYKMYLQNLEELNTGVIYDFEEDPSLDNDDILDIKNDKNLEKSLKKK